MAIEILQALENSSQPTERFLNSWFRTRRFAGAKDRRAILEQVYYVQRNRATLAYRMGSEEPRALAIAALLKSGEDIESLFDPANAGAYGPPPLTTQEHAVIALKPFVENTSPDWVRGEYPLWLEEELKAQFGDRVLDEMTAMKARAPVDLRINSLKATRDEVMAVLKSAQIESSATAYAPFGIRIAVPVANLARSDLFESGAFEFQDEGAQIVCSLCEVRPGMRVLDLAAGAGGKSLALAAAMDNQGEIVACDLRDEALFELERRRSRAGAHIIQAMSLDHSRPDGLFDLVLVDAPCSGTGTWRRQPELRWRLTPARLGELMAIQDQLLDQARGHLRPGGRLVYATCSVLPCENHDRIQAFLRRQSGFTWKNLAESWQGARPPGLGMDFRASPLRTGTDGFYCAALINA